MQSNPACPHCSNRSVKNGKHNAKQRFLCSTCSKTFYTQYSYKAYHPQTNYYISSYIKESCGIRSIARLLKISTTTILSRILKIAAQITKPKLTLYKNYELDEMCTYIQKKTRLRWIVYAIRSDTKEVVDFCVGRRTNKVLNQVIQTLLLSQATKVSTDKLPAYRYLIPESVHSTQFRSTNHIERKNLSLRTHLKRLTRRTICYSKSASLLTACLRIYFWSSLSSI